MRSKRKKLVVRNFNLFTLRASIQLHEFSTFLRETFTPHFSHIYLSTAEFCAQEIENSHFLIETSFQCFHR